MSFSDVHPGDPINAVNVQQVIDALKGTVGKGIPLVVDAVNDGTRYALTLQNDDTVNSRAINVLKADGSVLIAADATGVTLGSPVNLQPNSVPGTAITNASITNQKLGPDVARANLLTNGGFEIWQRGSGPFTAGFSADRWAVNLASGDTLSVSQNGAAANLDAGSQYCAAATFTRSTGGSNLEQNFNEMLVRLRGNTISFSARVKCSTANAVRLRIFDGSSNYSAYHTGSGNYETLTVTRALMIGTANLLIDFMFDASCTAYIDNAMLVVGSQPCDYVPLHPADDLARCLRYYQKWLGSGNHVMAVNYVVSATTAAAIFAPKAFFAVAPTVTVSAPGDWGMSSGASAVLACTSLSVLYYITGMLAASGVVAGGLTTGQSGAFAGYTANGWIAAEANP